MKELNKLGLLLKQIVFIYSTNKQTNKQTNKRNLLVQSWQGFALTGRVCTYVRIKHDWFTKSTYIQRHLLVYKQETQHKHVQAATKNK